MLDWLTEVAYINASDLRLSRIISIFLGVREGKTGLVPSNAGYSG